MTKQYYYAVNKGRKPGIYLSWLECREQVNDYKFPIYKKFETLEEAEDFVKKGKMTKKLLDDKILVKEDIKDIEHIKADYVYLFCDGSALHQNYKSVRCGYGICMIKPNYEISMYSKLVNNIGTNNLAELMAIMDSLKLIETNKISKTCIVSDSKYSLDCILVWSITWKKNNWLTSKKTEPENSDLIKEILEKYELLLQKNYIIEFKHINSHKTRPSDISSYEYFLWFGNEMADQLARDGKIIKEYESP
jgi:ribonuclease HI